jgi:DNA-binding transcriptional ArsR family regulator
MPSMNPPCRQTLDTLADTFKALAHPARLAIVHALADGPICAYDLSEIADSSASTTSRHLTVLRHAGIISKSREGQQIFYQLERPCVLTFMDCCST